MYIVICTPIMPLNAMHSFGSHNPTVNYFQTRQQLETYLKTATGNIRVFEGHELAYSVDIKITDKTIPAFPDYPSYPKT